VLELLIVKKTLDEFDKILGLDKLKLIHLNDSKTDLGSRVDRHEHIGKGKIGLKGFKALLSDKRLKNINLILETPADNERPKDMEEIKKIRKIYFCCKLMISMTGMMFFATT